MAFKNNNSNNSNNNKEQFKKSGYEVKRVDDVTVCFGWRKTKLGIQRMYARPYDKTTEHESKTGRKWLNYFVTIVNASVPIIYKGSALFEPATNKLLIKELGLCGTTVGGGKTKNGHMSKGYFGKLGK
jgi:hypothetical protein